MRLFINYKQNVEPDHSLAKVLEERLRREGHQVFRDETKMKSGEEWPARLEQEVRRCQGMISLLSNVALRSSWVLNEIQLAKKLEKRMFPFLLEDIEESLRFQALNPYFMSTHWTQLTGNETEDLDTISMALTEPRHVCYRDLIDMKLSEYGIPDGREVLEALCGVMWQAHWPTRIFGYATLHAGAKRLNGESARSLAETLRNELETVANLSDQNASEYLKKGSAGVASRMAWQVQRLRCFADIIDSLISGWNEACDGARERLEQQGPINSPIFDTSDGERAFAPLDEHSAESRFNPAPNAIAAYMRFPRNFQYPEDQNRISALRLCEYLDDGKREHQADVDRHSR